MKTCQHHSLPYILALLNTKWLNKRHNVNESGLGLGSTPYYWTKFRLFKVNESEFAWLPVSVDDTIEIEHWEANKCLEDRVNNDERFFWQKTRKIFPVLVSMCNRPLCRSYKVTRCYQLRLQKDMVKSHVDPFFNDLRKNIGRNTILGLDAPHEFEHEIILQKF